MSGGICKADGCVYDFTVVVYGGLSAARCGCEGLLLEEGRVSDSGRRWTGNRR